MEILKNNTIEGEYRFKVLFEDVKVFVKAYEVGNRKVRVSCSKKQLNEDQARSILEFVIAEPYRFCNEKKINDHCPTEFVFTR